MQKSYWEMVCFLANLGINFAVIVAICMLICGFVGEKLGYYNIGIICGIFLGITTAIYSIYKKLIRLNK